MNLLENEGLAWESFQQAVTDKDIVICYDMFVKEFECSTVHDLFKVFFFRLESSIIDILVHLSYIQSF